MFKFISKLFVKNDNKVSTKTLWRHNLYIYMKGNGNARHLITQIDDSCDPMYEDFMNWFIGGDSELTWITTNHDSVHVVCRSEISHFTIEKFSFKTEE